jgi:hypothetical protein
MALEGNLSAFGLSEILQLIAVQQKTGMLTVSSQTSNAVIFFREGSIVSTRDRRRKAKDPFKEYLTRYGVLTREQLIKVTQISSQSKLDLLDIIGSEGFMTQDEIRSHFQKQIQESLHEVLSWDQCSYKFISNADVVEGIATAGEFSIEGMLMESMRRIDEFPQMLEMFPNDRVLVTRTDGDKAVEGLTKNEQTIMALLDDSRSLRDLLARGKMPLFEVYESLKLLSEKELITTKDDGPSEAERHDNKVAARKAAARRNPAPFLGVLILFLATLFLGATGFLRNFEAHRMAVMESIESNSIARHQVEQRLRWVLEAYRAQHGAYPRSLEVVKETGIAPPHLFKMVDLFSFRYQLTPGGAAYTLL